VSERPKGVIQDVNRTEALEAEVLAARHQCAALRDENSELRAQVEVLRRTAIEPESAADYDPELCTLREIVNAFSQLNQAARARVLAWASDRYGRR